MGERRTILEEEIEQLKCLQDLMKAEKDCLAGMNGEGLLQVVREKDGLVRRLGQLKQKRQSLRGETDPIAGQPAQALRDLLGVRNALISEIREQSRIHERILEDQSEQVGRLLGFFQSVFSRSSVYDRNGRMRSP
jgi:flagellar biosynthesis/type III secretory pathway chaperone